MAQATLNVPDISCEHCQRTITNALTPVEGVRRVIVDISSKQVEVDYDEATVDVERMKEILEEEDYPVASAEAGAGQDRS
jgi:copper chaperone